MVRHVIGWDYADGFTLEENLSHAKNMKVELENLIHLIDGIISIKLSFHPVDTSDAAVFLDSTFESEEALKAYTVHPEHVRVANNFVRPFVKNRRCFDYTLE